MNDIYNFVYRGILTDESLDKAGRTRRKIIGPQDSEKLRKALSYEMMEAEYLFQAEEMSIVYIALHAFENIIRDFVKKAMAEHFDESWWEKVPEKIKKRVESRKEDDAKFRWHGSRGTDDIMYCDFGDLSSIIATNWEIFVDVVVDLEWSKALLSTLERSRNIIMHGGVISREDIERIGMNIRDWVRQIG